MLRPGPSTGSRDTPKSTKVHIGLDVHKNSIVVAYALADGSEPKNFGGWGGSNLSAERGMLRLLKKLGVSKGEVRVCYEAGPTGFVLARRLLQLGYDCIIVAPSAVPKAPGERVKIAFLRQALRAGFASPMPLRGGQ